jgi:hypothetical protein
VGTCPGDNLKAGTTPALSGEGHRQPPVWEPRVWNPLYGPRRRQAWQVDGFNFALRAVRG